MPDSPSTTETFPRASARTRAFTRGAPRSMQLDPTGAATPVHPGPRRQRPGRLPVEHGHRLRRRDPGRRRAGAARRGRRAALGRGAVTARALPGGGGRHRVVRDRRRGRGRRVRPVQPVVAGGPDRPGRSVRARAARGRAGRRPAAGPDRRAASPTWPTAPSTSWAPTAPRARTLAAPDAADRAVGRRRVRRGRGDGTGTAATGGRRTASSLLVARVDDAPVQRWHIADPAHPERTAAELAYPAAGTANADVTVHVVAADGSTTTEVTWDRSAFPYLVAVHWSAAGALLHVMTRDQRDSQVLDVDPATGVTSVRRTDHDDVWLDVVVGVPALLPDGRLVTTLDHDGARRVAIDGEPVTAADLADVQVTRDRLGRGGRHRGRRHRRAHREPSLAGGSRRVAATADRARRLPRRAARRRHSGRRHPAPRDAGHRRHGPPWGGRAGHRPVVRREATAARGGAAVPGRAARPAGRAAAPDRPRARHAAPGADGPLRRSPPPGGARRPRHLAGAAVVGRPGLRGRGRGRTGHRLARSRLGPGGPRRHRGRHAGGPGDGAAGGRRPGAGPRPVPGGDPRLVVRRVPGCDGRPSPPGRLPRGGGRCSGDRLAALRHLLHRALPRAPGRGPGGLRPHVPDRRRGQARTAAAADPRPCGRQRRGRPHAAAVLGAARRRASARRAAAVGRHAHDATGGRHREPAAPAARLAAAGARRLDERSTGTRASAAPRSSSRVSRPRTRPVLPAAARMASSVPAT